MSFTLPSSSSREIDLCLSVPYILDEIGSSSVLHVSRFRSTTQLYPRRCCTRLLWVLRNHKLRSLAHQSTFNISSIPLYRAMYWHVCVPASQVGSKTVEQQVMLVESSYFPVILGRYVSSSLTITPPLRSLISREDGIVDHSWRGEEFERILWIKLLSFSWTRTKRSRRI